MPSKALKLPPYREDKENYGPAKEEFVTYIEEDVEEEGTSRDTGRTMRKCTSRDAQIFLLDRLADKLAKKDSLAVKLAQRPPKQELIDRNILPAMSDEDRRIDRSIIGEEKTIILTTFSFFCIESKY